MTVYILCGKNQQERTVMGRCDAGGIYLFMELWNDTFVVFGGVFREEQKGLLPV